VWKPRRVSEIERIDELWVSCSSDARDRSNPRSEAGTIRRARDSDDPGSQPAQERESALPQARYGARVSDLPPIDGELLRMNDVDTGFDKFSPPDGPKEGRPYVVIGKAFGGRVRVVPESTKGTRGVYVPDGAVDGLKEGRFIPWSTPVRISRAARCESIGYLPNPYLDRVKEQWQRRTRRRKPDA
jgi:hypothetical protein